jgi:hypothetical protein
MCDYRSAFPCALLSALVLFAAGCGGTKLVPVEGKVMMGNQPLTKGEVSYHPDVEGGNTQKYPDLPRGKIGADGTYTLSTSGKPGAPAGKYKVTVNPSAGEAPADYSIPKDVIEKSSTLPTTTTLRKEVKADAPAGHYDVTVNPPK